MMSMEAVMNGGKAKSVKETESTLRFHLQLDNPTDETTNEFLYSELTSEKSRKHTTDTLDPLTEDEDAKLAAIAKQFEEKYGSQNKKSKRVIHEKDLVDIGHGYDVTDPFVDDTEVYEDYVPYHVDTVFGGFYINTGELEFKEAENIKETMNDTPAKKKKPKPIVRKQPSHCTPKALLANKKLKLAKQQIATSAQRSQNLKKKLSNLAQKANPKVLLPEFSGIKPKPQVEEGGGGGGSVKSDVVTKSGDIPMSDSDHGITSFASSTEGSENETKDPRQPPVLPTDLSIHLLQKIQELEELINRDQKEDGKLTNKARYGYDSILLDIESQCKNMKMKPRSGVFDYLAFKMGINKASLFSRIKRTIKKKEAGNLGGPLQLLKAAIDEVMPIYNALYEAEVRVFCSTSSMNKEEQLLVKESSSITSDQVFEESHSQLPGASDTATKPKRPRKKFQWTPKIKSLLIEVVRQKVEMELANKNKILSGEEIIIKFLDNTIKPLWPKGWVQRRTLYKLTETVHSPLTGAGTHKKVAPKKVVKTSQSSQLSTILPPYEGSTQASYGSVMEFISDNTKSLPGSSLSPPVKSSAIISPSKVLGKTSLATIFTSSSPNISPPLLNLKPAIVSNPQNLQSTSSSSFIHNPVIPGSAILPKVNLNAKLRPHTPPKPPIASKVTNTTALSCSTKDKTIVSGTVSPKKASVFINSPNVQYTAVKQAIPSPTVSTGIHKSPIGPNAIKKTGVLGTPPNNKSITFPVNRSIGGVPKGHNVSPLSNVIPRGPTKVTKISTPSNINLSQEAIQAIMRSIKSSPNLLGTPNTLSPQQIHLLLQQPPSSSRSGNQAKPTPAITQSPVSSTGYVSGPPNAVVLVSQTPSHNIPASSSMLQSRTSMQSKQVLGTNPYLINRGNIPIDLHNIMTRTSPHNLPQAGPLVSAPQFGTSRPVSQVLTEHSYTLPVTTPIETLASSQSNLGLMQRFPSPLNQTAPGSGIRTANLQSSLLREKKKE